MQNALYSPFASRLNPKDVDQCGATHSFIWWARWAESGGLTRCELKWPSFGCLNSIQVWTGRWGPFHFIVLTWLTDKWNNFGWILFITKLDWLEILVVSEIQPYWSAVLFGGVIDFQVDGARHFSKVLTRWSKHSLHRHIPVPAIFLAANVALMVWSNHDENN